MKLHRDSKGKPAAEKPGGEATAPRERASDAGGISMVEATVSLFVLALILLSIAQLLGVSVYLNKMSEDMTLVSSLANYKMEELKNRPYLTLTAGGSLASDITNFYDTPDLEGDGKPDFTRRWVVTDLGDRKMIQVLVLAQIAAGAPVRETTLAAVVAQQ